MMSLETKSADFSLFGEMNHINRVGLLTIYYHLTTHDRLIKELVAMWNITPNSYLLGLDRPVVI